MPEVKKVHENRLFKPLLDVSVPYIRAPQVYGAVKELTPFDDFREGFEGQGIHISIIDTGVEWQHPMFGGDPTPPRLGIEPAMANRNQKIIYNLPLMDSVVEDTVGHGTHVAATAAGYLAFANGKDNLPNTADDIRMHGVAPQAKIMAYNVCSNALSNVGSLTGAIGGCFEEVIAMAIEDSMSPFTVTGFPKPVAHVINMSLGGPGGPDGFSATAADNAVRLGATVVAAAGNDGPGPATSGAPCAGRLVTCVANSVDPAGSWSWDLINPASVNRLLPGAVSPASSLPLAAGLRNDIPVEPMGGSESPANGSIAQYYVYVSGGETPASYPASVAGRIALVRTSLQSTFAQVANSAFTAGAVAVIMRTTVTNPTAVKVLIPAMVMVPEQFDYLVSLMGAGAVPPSGTLSQHPLRINDSYRETMMATSSSRGPVEGFGQIKPDLSGPGTNILAAVPAPSLLGVLAQGNYASISGTSMASPHVAGAAALVKQSHPAWTGDMVRTALMNTSTNLRNHLGIAKGDSNTAETTLDQGAGLIDVQAAVNVKALLGVTGDGLVIPTILGSHSFGEVPSINSRSITTRTVSVTMQDVSGSGGTYNLAVANNRGLDLPGVSVTAPASVSVPANGTATFDVTIRIDGSQLTNGNVSEIQWYVRAMRSGGGESLAMPFYLRATRTAPPPATMNAVSDDSTPDQLNGVDRDGHYNLSWTYAAEGAVPCGWRVEEAPVSTSGTIWYDDAEELFVSGGNTRWAAVNWTSRPDLSSTRYGAVYIDQSTASLTMTSPVALPNGVIGLSFHSDEDIEPDFDFGFVDVSIDSGATWTTLATYTGLFLGERSVDLTAFAGNSALLRFRLVSDQLVSTPVHLGWTIDDIRIRAGAPFNTIAVVPGTSHAVSGKSDGVYAYRVIPLFDNCAVNPFAGTPSNIVQIEVRVEVAPPTASATSSSNPSDAGQAVTFDASTSTDNDSVGSLPGITEYRWTFGDGEAGSGASVSHAYSAAGTYRVALTVIDDDGDAASTDFLQTVREANANISGGGTIGRISFSVNAQSVAGAASGDLLWHDKSAKMRIESSSFTAVQRSGGQAVISATCTINKKSTTPCTLTLVDNGASGDTASLSAGSYTGGGTVTNGGITVAE
jgi:subtilisin family serine protease/PKD repeat protein